MHTHTLLSFSLSLFAFVRNCVAQGTMPPLPQSTATIVLVPGAFHIDSSMDLLGAQLQRAGYNTHSASLVTVNGPSKNISDDIDYLQTQVLEPLIGQQGRDIVLYLHSYAGFPGSVAIEGYSKTARLANGTAGGILGLIYQSAFIPKQGDSLLQMIGGNYAPWQQLNDATRLITVPHPIETFYADVPAPLADAATRQLYGQSIISFNSASGNTFWGSTAFTGRRAYIRTGQDQALPSFAQDMMLNGSGVPWDIHRLDNSSHSPFLSQPVSLAALVSNLTMGFEQSYRPA